MGEVIIFVGPDMTGKTNIAQELSRKTGIPYFKNKGEWANFEKGDDYFVNCMKYGDLGFFSQYLAQSDANVIMDRGYPCEWVYSKVFERDTDESVLQRLDSVYASLGAKIIVCVRKKYTVGDDMFSCITPQKLEELHDKYMDFARWTKCKTAMIFVDDENLERETREIIRFLYDVSLSA